MSDAQPERLPPGVRLLDHTADVGLELDAPDLATLFVRAAQGAEALLGPPAPASVPAETLTIHLQTDDVALLLADWLRELLFLRQVRGLSFVQADFEALSAHGLSAHVQLASAPGDAVREIKGVTYHGLEAVQHGNRWHARVIFDV